MAAPLPDGSCGIAYTPYQVEATGGTPPYLFSVCGLPPDLDCDSAGVIMGAPAYNTYGTWDVTVTCDDNAGFTAYAVKQILIHAAVGMSAFYHGFSPQVNNNASVDVPEVADGELNMILIWLTRTTPAGVPTPPTIAGWDFVDSGADTAEFQCWRYDRVRQAGDPTQVTGIDLGTECTGLLMGLGFYFGDETGLVSEFSHTEGNATLNMTGIQPTVTSDATMIAVAYAPGVVLSIPVGWQENLGTAFDEFIGWPVTQMAYMQWPDTDFLTGPTIQAAPTAPPRIAGWCFAMPRT